MKPREGEPTVRVGAKRARTTPPAIILGGYLNALSAARTLGRYGVEVHVLPEAGRWEPLRRSRYVRNAEDWYFFEGADYTGARWLQYLRQSAVTLSGAVLLPCGDNGLEFLARHWQALADLGYRPSTANYDAVIDMLDKAKTYSLAREAGVPVPKTALVTSLEDLRAEAAHFRYPCALKPVHSHRFRRYFDVKGFVVTNSVELEERYRSIHQLDVEVLLTEIVRGVDDSYWSYFAYIDEDGTPLARLTKCKLRQYPNGFGGGTYHMTGWEPEVAKLGEQFATFAGLRGVVNIEFKRDVKDGNLKLIECNPRLVVPNELIRRAGVDLARIAYDRTLGLPVTPPGRFREGLYIWLPTADYRAFREYRSKGELTTFQWLVSLMHRQTIPLVAIDDLAPAAAWLAGLVRRQ